jgi:hypothetical protein
MLKNPVKKFVNVTAMPRKVACWPRLPKLQKRGTIFSLGAALAVARLHMNFQSAYSA